MFRSLAFIALVFAAASPTRADIAQSPPVKGEFVVALRWITTDGKVGKKIFDELKLADISQEGVWLAFEKRAGGVFPSVFYRGRFHSADTPVEKMRSLDFYAATEVKVKDTVVRFTTIFDRSRPFGSRGVDADNVYHLLVLNRAIDKSDLPASLDAKTISQKERRASFWRTHRLAMNYAAQSDAATRKYERAFQVKAKYTLPRMILASEEWIELKTEKKKPSGGGGFGGGFGVLNRIGADPTPKTRRFPIYNMDVLMDQVAAEGAYARGFQTTRSLWNDILEGKVIYEAAGGNRRVLTASIVFAQMEKNRTKRRARNRTLTVDAKSLAELNRCQKLWSPTKKSITSFLKKNPTWTVIIPENPVTFYEKDKPIYAIYAWYQVQPSSGRMIGMLPNGNHAGMSDEAAKIAQTGIDKVRERVVKEAGGGGAVKGFFGQVAGMYVSAAGILEGVTLTFCNPALAELNGKEWTKFLAMHALDHAQKFLEEHADQYDSYAAQLSFWQGAMVLTSALGGKDAAREVGRRAIEGVGKKAKKDLEKYADDLKGKAEEAAKEAVREQFRDFVNGVVTTDRALRSGL